MNAIASHAMQPTERLLRLPEVLARCGLSRTGLYKLLKEGKFPRPRQLTARAVAWRESDVAEFVASRPTVLR